MGISSFRILTLQLLPLSTSGAGFPFPLFSPAGPLHFLAGGQGSPCSPSGHLCVVIMYRGPGRLRVGVLALSSVLWFSFHNVLALVYLRGRALEQECPPFFPHLPFFLFSFLFTHLPLCSQASPALSHQGPHLSPCFPSSPYLGKGSSPELQGVEPNVYILLSLLPPRAALQGIRKEPAVVPGPVSCLVI